MKIESELHKMLLRSAHSSPTLFEPTQSSIMILIYLPQSTIISHIFFISQRMEWNKNVFGLIRYAYLIKYMPFFKEFAIEIP